MQHNDEIAGFSRKDEQLDIKDILFKILSKWYWFAICGFLGLSIGWVVNRYSLLIWQVETTIMVSDASKKPGIDNLFDRFSLAPKINLQNHIELLKSYSLNRMTIENLGWRTSWFAKGKFIDSEFYNNEPFSVVEPDGWVNPDNIQIYVSVLSDNLFEVKFDYQDSINGRLDLIRFKQECKLGIPVRSPQICFTLNKRNGSLRIGSNYYFKFNDANKFTLMYSGKANKLAVGLTDKTSEILKLTVRGTQPSREVDFLNELSNVYIQFGLREKNRTAENTVRFIESQLTGIADSLRITGQSFTNFRSDNQVINLSQEGSQILTKGSSLETEKAVLEMRLTYYQNLKNYITSSDLMKKAITPSIIGITDPSLNNMVMKLAELYSKREVLSFSAEDKNPAIIMINNEIFSTRNNLAENLNNLESDSKIQLENLKSRIIEISKIAEQLPQTEQQFINYKRRFDVNNELYTFLLTKKAEAAISKASSVADSQVIDKARIETASVVGPNTFLNLMIGLILGLGTPLVVILLIGFFNDTIKNREEVERSTNLPILGEIGHNRYDKEFVTIEHPRSEIAESFRGLRTNLQYILKGHDQNVIGIHSTIPGEGKSFISLNLATIIAMNDKKVLLVATDMRKPRLNALFDIDHKQTGLSTYLINRDSFDEVVRTTHVPNLSFVSSGPIPPNPSELLENGGFKRFIEEAKKVYDYVIIDNAPVPVVTDGLISARYCDANIFVVRQEYSHIAQVYYIDQLATKEMMPQVCLVINDVEIHGYGYRNKYGYGKYGYGKYGYGRYGYGRYGGYSGYYDDVQRLTRWEKFFKKFLKKIKK
ncbi:MAG: polysaccharide biosynthesis tyrosine autokinase [Mariniphaga sp.]